MASIWFIFILLWNWAWISFLFYQSRFFVLEQMVQFILIGTNSDEADSICLTGKNSNGHQLLILCTLWCIHYNCVQSFFGLMFHSIWYCHFWQAILLCETLVLLEIAFYRADSLLNSHCWPKPPTHTKQHRPIECHLIKSIGSQSGRCVKQLSEKGGAN